MIEQLLSLPRTFLDVEFSDIEIVCSSRRGLTLTTEHVDRKLDKVQQTPGTDSDHTHVTHARTDKWPRIRVMFLIQTLQARRSCVGQVPAHKCTSRSEVQSTEAE